MLYYVNKYTRAGHNGKIIFCPVCMERRRVWGFAWRWMKCKLCTLKINKEDWLYEEPKPVKQDKRYLKSEY